VRAQPSGRPQSGASATAPEDARLFAAPSRYFVAGSTSGSCLLVNLEIARR
jgi:hypothetical protein